MSIKILLDMNLSPEWVPRLKEGGWETIHWSAVGDPHAPDAEVMAWTLAHGYVLFTHDLDFGTTLALTHAVGPSVLQIRGRNMLPENIGSLVFAAIRRYEQELEKGALVVVDEGRSRIRVLPIT